LTSLTHPTTSSRPRRAAHATAREARRRRGYDAVFASYIRELATAETAGRGAIRETRTVNE
jgi:hypothetical protein